MALMKERVAEVDPDFDINRSGFRLSGDMLRAWLSPLSAPLDLTETHTKSIQQAHRELNRIEGPDVAFSVPLDLIREVATAKIGDYDEALAALGLAVDPESVVLSFGDQAIDVTFPFRYEKDVVIEGRAVGKVFAGYAEGGPAFRAIVQKVEFETLSLPVKSAFNTNAFAGSVTLLLDELLPIINGALDALEVEIKQPKPYKVDFGPYVAKIEGLKVSPQTFTVPAPQAPRPLLLISDDRVSVIGDFKADYFSKRATTGGVIVDNTDPAAAFAAYSAAYQRVWESKFEWPKAPAAISAKVSTSRVAETLEKLWQLAGVKIKFEDQYGETSGRQPVAAFPARPRCKSACDRPACDRDRACPPRRICEDVSELVTVPVTVAKKVCKPVTSVINEPVKVTRKVCEKVLGLLGLDVLCKPIEVTEYVQRKVTDTVCDTVDVVEQTQKWVTRESCEVVTDTACLVTLEKCVLEWAAYDVCSAPFKLCTETLRAVSKGLQAFDFDKFGYASAEASYGLLVDIDTPSILDVGNDLRTVTLLPRVSGSVTVNAKVKFEPRASAFLACVPLKPLGLSNYRLKLHNQTPRVKASITPIDPVVPDSGTAALELAVSLRPVTVTGRFSQAPLTKLLLDNPETLLTCPVVAAGAAVSELLGSTGLTRDALEKAVKTLAGQMAADIARLLLDGTVTREVDLPSLNVLVPSLTLGVGSKDIEFVPSFLGHEIAFTSL